jgi:hypothetical protein
VDPLGHFEKQRPFTGKKSVEHVAAPVDLENITFATTGPMSEANLLSPVQKKGRKFAGTVL